MRFKNICILSIGAAIVLAIGACNNDVKQAPPSAAAPATKAPAMMEPFKFHKMLEVAPGNDFDVLSWARGGGDKNSLLILHSDSAAKDYTTTTGDLDGPVIDVYNSDMDVDGNPEIIIQSKTPDTNKFMNITIYEFNGGKGNKLDFPRLTTSQRKGYRGGDNLYVTQGKLMRQFPVYDGDTKNAKPTGEKRLLEYSMHGNNLSAQTVDTTSIKTTPVKSDKQAATSTSSGDSKKSSSNNSDNSSSSKKSKKHQESDQPKKKKKKHHRD